MSNFPLAFVFGIIGSLHCAVMCGPIMLSLPVAKSNKLNSFFQLFTYQFGRILVYVLLGLIVGFIGNSITVFASQQTLSVIIGFILVVFAILHFTGNSLSLTKLIYPISKLMGKVYQLPFWGFFAGMLNGLIPCGMVYLALATALNTANIKSAGTFMLLFGLGTTPLMLIISLGGIYLRRYIKFNPNKLMPWFMLFIGALFILRSANLGIPFFSPNTGYHAQGDAKLCR